MKRDPLDYKGAFEKLPGAPPSHKIMGELKDGTKVPAAAVEMVWNDCLFINWCNGIGEYQRAADPRELEVLTMARRLYQGRKEMRDRLILLLHDELQRQALPFEGLDLGAMADQIMAQFSVSDLDKSPAQ